MRKKKPRERRRENGEGSVFHVASRKKWRAQVMMKDRLGRPVAKTKDFETEEEAEAWRVEQLHKRNKGIALPPDRITVADYLDYWLEEVTKPPLTRPKTHESYRYHAGHIKEILGAVPLQKLTQPMVQTFINRKSDRLSGKTVKEMRATLRAALNVAIDEGLIERNVAAKVKLPEYEPKEIQIFSRDQAQGFLNAIQGHRLEAAFMIETIFGFRRGEVLGLRPEDFDWKRECFIVRRQLQRIDPPEEDQKPYYDLVPTKSKAANRYLPLMEPWAGAVRRRLELVESYRANAGEAFLSEGKLSGLLFCTEAGTHFQVRNYQREFDAVLKKAGLPKVSLHSLRHLANTVLATLGVHPRVQMAVTGSSDVGVAMRVYTKAPPEAVDQAVRSVRDFYFPEEAKPENPGLKTVPTTDRATDKTGGKRVA